jgi:predicted nucleic acid-binding protein
VHVLNEFTSVTRRKLGWQWEQIEAALAVIEQLIGPARPLTAAIHAQAVVLAREHKLSFYDALIVAAVEDAGCRALFSEDCSTAGSSVLSRSRICSAGKSAR